MTNPQQLTNMLTDYTLLPSSSERMFGRDLINRMITQNIFLLQTDTNKHLFCYMYTYTYYITKQIFH